MYTTGSNEPEQRTLASRNKNNKLIINNDITQENI